MYHPLPQWEPTVAFSSFDAHTSGFAILHTELYAILSFFLSHLYGSAVAFLDGWRPSE